MGLSIGDALGTTNEFKRREDVIIVSDLVGGGPFNLPVCYWTDDTSMMLCLGNSLLHVEGFDGHDQLRRYLWWRDTGYLSSTGECFDIGDACNLALTHYKQNPTDPYPGRVVTVGDNRSGNGSLMRLSPIPLVYHAHPRLFEYLGLSSEVTHGSLKCIDSCKLYGGIMAGLLLGDSKEEVLSPYYKSPTSIWGDELHEEVLRISAGSYKSLPESCVSSSGYVIDSMEAALWAFYNTDNFRDGALLCANWGDDSDTVAAIYGQLAGIHYGIGGIPTEWITKLHQSCILSNVGVDLHALSELSAPKC